MSVTVAGLYQEMETAQRVVDELVSHHFDRSQISIVAQGEQKKVGAFHTGTREAAITTITRDAEIGAVVGGLALGLAALAIPGIGPLVAAGPIAAVLVGLGVGAATGGLIGALQDVGLSYEQVEYYAEGIRQGHVLVTVQAPEERATEAQDILNQYAPIKREGQTGAQPNIPANSAAETAKQEAPVQTEMGPKVV